MVDEANFFFFFFLHDASMPHKERYAFLLHMICLLRFTLQNVLNPLQCSS